MYVFRSNFGSSRWAQVVWLQERGLCSRLGLSARGCLGARPGSNLIISMARVRRHGTQSGLVGLTGRPNGLGTVGETMIGRVVTPAWNTGSGAGLRTVAVLIGLGNGHRSTRCLCQSVN